jgi:hypothetical protein
MRRTYPYSFCDLKMAEEAAERLHATRGFREWFSATTYGYFAHPNQWVFMGGSSYISMKNYLTCKHPMYSTSEIYMAAFIDILFAPGDSDLSMIYLVVSNCLLVIFFIFVTEEFEYTAWVAGSLKFASEQLLTFAPIFAAIIAAATAMLVVRFGCYFWQFRDPMHAMASSYGWAVGSPITAVADNVDFLLYAESRTLSLYYLALTAFVVIFAGNIFIAIIMNAYEASKESASWKGHKNSHYTLAQNINSMSKTFWFNALFPNCQKS